MVSLIDNDTLDGKPSMIGGMQEIFWLHKSLCCLDGVMGALWMLFLCTRLCLICFNHSYVSFVGKIKKFGYLLPTARSQNQGIRHRALKSSQAPAANRSVAGFAAGYFCLLSKDFFTFLPC